MKYMKMPIESVLKIGPDYPFYLYLILSDEVLGYSFDDKERLQVFSHYQKEGIEFAYANIQEYMEYCENLKKNLRNRFANPKTFKESKDVAKTLDSCHLAVKAIFNNDNIPEASINLAKQLAMESLKVIEKTPDIYYLFEDFKDNCSEQFMFSLFSGYLTTCILEHFEWATSATKKKLTLAGILCDAALNEDGWIEKYRKIDRPEDLSSRVRFHPIEISEALRPNLQNFSSDILKIISEHHERPDGTGYPDNLKHTQVSVLSAIFIVTYDFVNRLDMKNINKDDVNYLLKAFKEKYNIGTYRQAYHALEKVLAP